MFVTAVTTVTTKKMIVSRKKFFCLLTDCVSYFCPKKINLIQKHMICFGDTGDTGDTALLREKIVVTKFLALVTVVTKKK